MPSFGFINVTAAGGGGSGVVYIETSGPSVPQSQDPPDDPRISQVPGSPRISDHPRTPRASQDSQTIPGSQDPGSPGPKSARQAAHSELLAEGVTRPAGLLWDHFVPPLLHRIPLIWSHRWRSVPQMAQHRASSKMALWGALPSEACFAPDSLGLGTPERTLGGVTFRAVLHRIPSIWADAFPKRLHRLRLEPSPPHAPGAKMTAVVNNSLKRF